MNIYRFVPGSRGHAYVVRSLLGRWWPHGIDLGPMADLFFTLPPEVSWSHENRFIAAPEWSALPDFPALALNVPLLSPRAMKVLGVSDCIPVFVRDQPYFAVQPRRCPDVLDLSRSSGLTLPTGEVWYYTARHFRTERIQGEFFALDPLQPFSDLYVTGALIDLARKEGLTGLEHCELVFDGTRPITPRYHNPSRVERLEIAKTHANMRVDREWELIGWRCDAWDCPRADAREAFELALDVGFIAHDFGLEGDRIGQACAFAAKNPARFMRVLIGTVIVSMLEAQGNHEALKVLVTAVKECSDEQLAETLRQIMNPSITWYEALGSAARGLENAMHGHTIHGHGGIAETALRRAVAGGALPESVKQLIEQLSL